MSQLFTDKPITDLKKSISDHPTIFLHCFRSKNNNVMVYNALDNGNKAEGFWLMLDKEYRKTRYKTMLEKKEAFHDREEMNYIERKFAWSFQFDPKTRRFTFGLLAKLPLFMKVKTDKKTGEEKAYLNCALGGRKYIIHSMYVDTGESYSLTKLNPTNLLSQVDILYIQGLDITEKNNHHPAKVEIIKDGKLLFEELMPEKFWDMLTK